MAHSLEIRVPLVDAALFRRLAPWLGRAGGPAKADMARVPGTLPVAVIARPKTGFRVPIREWLAGEEGKFETARSLRGWAGLVYRASMSRK